MKRLLVAAVALVALASVAEAGRRSRYYNVWDYGSGNVYGITEQRFGYGSNITIMPYGNAYWGGPVNYPAPTLVNPGMGWNGIQYARPVPMLRPIQPLQPWGW